MTARERLSKEEAGDGETLRPASEIHDFAASLEDYLDEDVVDAQGMVIGTLACYWESVSGRLIFLGVELNGQDHVRIVPGRDSEIDERQSCIRVDFERAEVESAPHFDCSQELNKDLERAVYEHFHLTDPEPHGGLRHITRTSGETGK